MHAHARACARASVRTYRGGGEGLGGDLFPEVVQPLERAVRVLQPEPAVGRAARTRSLDRARDLPLQSPFAVQVAVAVALPPSRRRARARAHAADVCG